MFSEPAAAPDVEHIQVPWTLWAAFLGGVVFMLALDLGVFHREAHRVSFREAATWTCVWIGLSLAFAGYIGWRFGMTSASEFITAYTLEKSLSIDNVFVFIVIFRFMKVKREHMHRVLYMGIVGALVLRAVFILGTTALLERFHFLLPIFGLFLLYTGFRLLFVHNDDDAENEEGAGDNWIKRFAERRLRVTNDFEGPVFIVRRDGKLWFTSLFVTLLMIEFSDVLFAVDSVPAAIGSVPSRDPFIIFTSNICAILGLRALFFLLEDIIDRFRFLGYGLGLVLAFVGAKMIMAEGVGKLGVYYLGAPSHWALEPFHVDPNLSLLIILGVLGISVLASAVIPKRAE